MFGGHGHSHGGGGGGAGAGANQMTPEEMQAHMQRVQSFMRNMQAANPNMPQFNNMMGPPTPQMMQAAQEFLKKQMQISAGGGMPDFQVPPIPLGFQGNAALNDKDSVIVKQDSASLNAAVATDDFSKVDIVKATQYGALERCQELVEAGYDINKPDRENVYLLHWAAINNHCHVAKYYIDKGAIVDAVGGELESTPLHWAARHGHIKMVVLLMAHGANPLLFDNEGFSVIHLATMYSHSPVVAYLLAKGIDPDMLDKHDITPLMYAAQRVHSRDPAQLLITFNARLNMQDKKGNTPLHYCIQFNNTTVMSVLLDKGASLEIKNNNGLNPLQFAYDRKKSNIAFMLNQYLIDDKENLHPILKPFTSNKSIRKLCTQAFPTITLFYFALTFNASLWYFYKLIILLCYVLVYQVFRLLFFDKNITKYVPIATSFAFIFSLYTTWFIYISPLVLSPSLYCVTFFTVTVLSWYNFYKSWKTNPGIIVNNRDQVNKSIIQYLEHNEISLDQFCTSCVVRKPLRSKHCSECDHCVSKFDHHCPWVDNCIGQFNLKYFILFIFFTPLCLVFYMDGVFKYFETQCSAGLENGTNKLDATLHYLQCSPFVSFFTGIAGFNLFWITCLFICHVYQAIIVAMTTNERMNMYRYKHFQDKNGRFTNPFNFGIVQNFVDLFDINFGPFKPTTVNWLKITDLDDLPKSASRRIKDAYDV